MKPRKRSPATEVRHLKREIKANWAKLNEQDALIERLRKKLAIGGILANICFNVAQRSGAPEDLRASAKEYHKKWDAIL